MRLWLTIMLLLSIQQLIASINGQIDIEDGKSAKEGIVEDVGRLERSLQTQQTSFPTGDHTVQPSSTMELTKEGGVGGIFHTLIVIPSGDYTQQPTSTFQPTGTPVVINDSLVEIKANVFFPINTDKLSSTTGNGANINAPIPTSNPTAVPTKSPTITPTVAPTPFPTAEQKRNKHIPKNPEAEVGKGVDGPAKKGGDKKDDKGANKGKISVATSPKVPDKDKNKDKDKDKEKGKDKDMDDKKGIPRSGEKKKQGPLAPPGRMVYQRFSGLLRGVPSSHLLTHMSRGIEEIKNEMEEIDTAGELF